MKTITIIGIGLICFFCFNIITYFIHERYKRRKDGNNNTGTDTTAIGIATNQETQRAAKEDTTADSGTAKDGGAE